MPLYEYKCEACGHRFEKIVKFSDPPLDACPKCGGKVEKLMSSPAFQFKGSGWYVTDYPKNSSDRSSGKAAADKESSSSSETKTDSTKTDSSATAAASSKDKS